MYQPWTPVLETNRDVASLSWKQMLFWVVFDRARGQAEKPKHFSNESSQQASLGTVGAIRCSLCSFTLWDNVPCFVLQSGFFESTLSSLCRALSLLQDGSVFLLGKQYFGAIRTRHYPHVVFAAGEFISAPGPWKKGFLRVLNENMCWLKSSEPGFMIRVFSMFSYHLSSVPIVLVSSSWVASSCDCRVA